MTNITNPESDFNPVEHCGNHTCDAHCIPRQFIVAMDNTIIPFNSLIQNPKDFGKCVDVKTNYDEHNKRKDTGSSGANKGERRSSRGGSSHFRK